MMIPLPIISQAYSLVVQQERHSPFSTPVDSIAFAFSLPNNSFQGRGTPTTQGRGRGRNSHRQPMLCTYCNRSNHTVETCYFKHWFPPGYRSKNASSSTNLATINTDQNSSVDTHVPPPKPTILTLRCQFPEKIFNTSSPCCNHPRMNMLLPLIL